MTDTAEILANKKIFAVGISGAKQRISGSWAAAGTLQHDTGIYPRASIRNYEGSIPRVEKDPVSVRTARAAVNKEVNNALSKSGKELNKYLGAANNQSTFRKLGSLPHRIAVNTVEANNATNFNEAMIQYLELVVPYVNEHAGGIIGDAIKEEYFQAGRTKWAPLHQILSLVKLEENILDLLYRYSVLHLLQLCLMDGKHTHIDGEISTQAVSHQRYGAEAR